MPTKKTKPKRTPLLRVQALREMNRQLTQELESARQDLRRQDQELNLQRARASSLLAMNAAQAERIKALSEQVEEETAKRVQKIRALIDAFNASEGIIEPVQVCRSIEKVLG